MFKVLFGRLANRLAVYLLAINLQFWYLWFNSCMARKADREVAG
jgi:hypothetical protein